MDPEVGRLTYVSGGRRALTGENPDGGQPVGQGRGSAAAPADPLAALVHPDGSVEELQPPGAAAFLKANPALVGYARAYAESASSQVGFFWQHARGQWS